MTATQEDRLRRASIRVFEILSKEGLTNQEISTVLVGTIIIMIRAEAKKGNEGPLNYEEAVYALNSIEEHVKVLRSSIDLLDQL